jgi:hypothetical protein
LMQKIWGKGKSLPVDGALKKSSPKS